MASPRRSIRDWLRALSPPPAAAPALREAAAAPPSSAPAHPVDWQPDAVPGAPPAIADQVIAAYRALGRWPLPQDFLEIASGKQGARPVPGSFTLPDGRVEAVEHLLHFQGDSFSDIVERRFPLQDVLDDGVIPFAECLGGDVLCFDFRADRENPTVAFWSVDTGLVPLAASFTAFVALLHD